MPSEFKVVIFGGGLVGALAALTFGNRGFTVELYEKRSDIRLESAAIGRSINLALSARGIEAIKNAGVEHLLLKSVIPMRGRFIHSVDGSESKQDYGIFGESINSVDRKLINEVLLTAAEKNPNVTLHFKSGMESCDFDTNTIVVLNEFGERVVIIDSDLIIGADGAYSKTRAQMQRHIRMNFMQEYIDHAYVELSMPATAEGNYAMDSNHLHIWPRQTFMMIALPNLDKSFTVTLFMPWDKFESIKTNEELLKFFETIFPDSIPLIGRKTLCHDYFTNERGPLMTIKCKPYHVQGKAVILGDAAHAMVPFYGQGMNCGFEDVLVLDEIFNQFVQDKSPSSSQLQEILEHYTNFRNPDAEAMCDLALHNYIEMRSDVTKTDYLRRKWVESWLHKLFPTSIIPLYTMVSFSRIRYSEALRRFHKQTKLYDYGMGFLRWGFVGVVSILLLSRVKLPCLGHIFKFSACE